MRTFCHTISLWCNYYDPSKHPVRYRTRNYKEFELLPWPRSRSARCAGFCTGLQTPRVSQTEFARTSKGLLYIYIYVYMYVCICTYIEVYTYQHICLFTFILLTCISMPVYMYVYIYIHIHIRIHSPVGQKWSQQRRGLLCSRPIGLVVGD